MKISNIVKNDVSNSITGYTLSIFTQGCIHECDGCFSEPTWDYNGGIVYSLEELRIIILESRHKNVSILGGDPFHPNNRDEVLKLIDWIKKETEKTLYLWTGFTFEEVKEWIDIKKIDYLITDPFEKDKIKDGLKLRGSSNQRIFKRGKLINAERGELAIW